MLDKIIRFSLANRLAVLIGAILLLFAGSYTAVNMEVDVFPDLNAPTVVVMTEAKGLSATEVENTVTFPVEASVNGATNVRRVRSSSTSGFSVVWVEFDWGTDIYKARQIVSEKLSAVAGTLPQGVGAPTLGPQGSILSELMIIGLSSDSVSQSELRTLADWTIRPRLLALQGVANVAVIGGDVSEYQILLNPDKMRQMGVSIDDVISATQSMNQNAPGGTLEEFGNEYLVRGILSTLSTEEIGKSLVKTSPDGAVLLEHIGSVQIGHKTPRLGVASERGKAGVLITVSKQPSTNTLELTERIDLTVAELQRSLPLGVNLSTDIFRQARFIESSISNIQKSLYEGGIFVVIVLFLFLMNVRTTVISLVTIPLSLLVSVLALKIMGLTINTMSLGGMAIAIGSLVDDAIVDVDNVLKRLRENRLRPADEQLSSIKVVFEASREVRLPILNSTLIIVASFVPLFFLTGMEGRMLAPLGIAFIVALFASTVVALTLTPVLCSYLLGGNKQLHNKIDREPLVARTLKRWYGNALSWTVDHIKLILMATSVAVVAAIIVAFTFGRSFLPPFNEGSFTINVSAMPGISLTESDRIGRMTEHILLSIPEVQTVARKTGRAELDEHALGVNTSEIEAPFELGDRTKEEVMADIREKLAVIPGVNIEIGQPISHRIDAMLSGTKASIAIKVFGPDLSRLHSIGQQIKAAVMDVEGVVDLSVEQQVERPEVLITPRREMMAKYGITMAQFSSAVEILMQGQAVSQVVDGNRRIDLTLKADTSRRDGIDAIRVIEIAPGVPLENVARITSSMGPNAINRENASRKIVVSANVADRDLRSVVDDIRSRIEQRVPMTEGYHVEYGGQFESEAAASQTLLVASIFSILVIFLLLYGQFKNTTQSLVVLLNLPLALIGGIFTIWFTSAIISIPAIIGFISLFGIATRNGMLLISRYNDLVEEGCSVREAVMKGSIDRLNPILMTALTSALALIPLALGATLPGSEIQSPMALVILGGLMSSTLLNGFVIPVMYIVTTKIKKTA